MGMATRRRTNAPQPLVVTDNAHFSDSASSHSDDESHLHYGAPGVGGDGLAKQGLGSGKRRRSGGIPSLISKSGSRSNLGVDAGITRAHEISRQEQIA